MPATLGGQITIVLGVITSLLVICGVIFRMYRTMLLHLEWVEQLWLVHARESGLDVPEWLIKKHMRLNGNEKMTSHEKDQVYGKNRPPSSDKHKSARALGITDKENQ